jgi:hypothetical protein
MTRSFSDEGECANCGCVCSYESECQCDIAECWGCEIECEEGENL